VDSVGFFDLMFGAGWLNNRIRPSIGRHFKKFVGYSVVHGCWDGKWEEAIDAVSKIGVK
jgi:hypothetical protein